MDRSWIRRRLWAVARVVVAVVAVVWVAQTIPWRDRVELPSGEDVVVESSSEPGWLRVVRDDGSVSRVADPGRDARRPGFVTVLGQADRRWLVMSLLMFGPVPLLAAWRFMWLMRQDGVGVGYVTAVRWTYIGNFFNFLVPGTTGGDVVKGVYATRQTDRKVETALVVVLDRAVGLVGMVLIGSLAGILSNAMGLRWTGVGLLVGLGVGGAALWWLAGRGDLLGGWRPRFGALSRLIDVAHAWRARPKALAQALVLTVGMHLLMLASYAVAGAAVGITHPFASFVPRIALALLVASVPITPMSVGTMEAAFLVTLVGPEASESQALFLAVAVRTLQMVWALPGGLWFLAAPRAQQRSVDAG